MTFSNPLYSAITLRFFDYLANNINHAFEKRCQELYYMGKQNNENTEVSEVLRTIEEKEIDKNEIKTLNNELTKNKIK
jgi:cell shape-determining protein MreC